MKILIVGIPGTGKTTIGNYLQNKRGYEHIDMESGDNILKAYKRPEQFICRLKNISGDLVVTWGFVPIDQFIDLIRELKILGFKVIWFDGNREFSKQSFIARNKEQGQEFLEKSMGDLRVQMDKINESKVIERIDPKIVDTFNPDGTFKSHEDIVSDILG